ncbi:MAG: hypothetical protein PUG50_05415 [Eubacteriales bacterium]|uniref:hypothetical protein n=1 Tax=Fenollaria sp. TaxID=1965292 RepID=UPI002A75BFF8|nr:hypothetical protein [Fenollaria sp.]MDD7340000.1 hypothetical protein [Eubacteriales bacterium]MDY3105466.1 hypothetical protein [Fenollaria sp.]
MKTVYDEAIDMLMKDGIPRDLIVRYINACIKNYYSDDGIINALKEWIMPKEFKENVDFTKAYIDAFRDATVLAEAIEVLPLPTKEAIDLINKKRKFIE